MKRYGNSKIKRSAAVLGMAALLAVFAAGCGAGPGGPAASDASGSGESLVVIGPAVISDTEQTAAPHTAPADSTASLPDTAAAETETAESPGSQTETASVQTEPETAAPEPTQPETAEPTQPALTEAETTAAPGKPGLWAAVPTDSADWATRAVSEITYYLEDFGYAVYVSPYDKDGDGVEDQADILQGAKDYVATRPVYDSGYFAGGWPPEGKGVCSDVIAYALLAAGYNLQELVDADVRAHPEVYNIAAGDNDPNIDYRRTRNLLPFFERFAESLTTDPYDYGAWQPGDIVIFASPKTGMWPGHIAVVSDRRASDGLPLLIHHTNNDRYAYEQDFLTTPQRIIKGHFRVSGFQKGQ